MTNKMINVTKVRTRHLRINMVAFFEQVKYSVLLFSSSYQLFVLSFRADGKKKESNFMLYEDPRDLGTQQLVRLSVLYVQ